MSKKTRYLLILIGFIIFLLLAPVIVLYVRGITFDVKTRKFTHTGILAIRTEPKAAKIFLDGKKVLNSAGDIKFLLPKEYNVTIQKDGYFDWSKRLPVLAGQVTWASPAPNKLYLFLKDPNTQTLSSGVLDFYADNDSLVYLNGNSMVVSSPSDPSRSENTNLPKPAKSLLASPNGQTFVLTDPVSSLLPPTILIFDKNSRNVTDLTGLFAAPVIFKFSANNQLYALANRVLYRVDVQQKTKAIIKNEVAAFAFRENDLYYLETTGTSTVATLGISSPPDSTGTIILNNIPNFNQGDIFVNFEREALLLLDGKLFRVGSTLENLANNVSIWGFNYNQSSLIFSHEGELGYYNPFKHNVDFVTRSSSAISGPILSLGFSHAFFIRGNKLESLELDTRDHQNNYVLYSGENLQKFSLDSNLVNAYVLDNGTLKILKIR